MSDYLSLPGQPMRCMHCDIPEDQSRSVACRPGYHHGFVTRCPGQSSVEAEAAIGALQDDLCDSGPRNDSVEDLARFISQVKHTHEKQLDRFRMEAEWRTKKRPPTSQSEPQGLFAQEQHELFE